MPDTYIIHTDILALLVLLWFFIAVLSYVAGYARGRIDGEAARSTRKEAR